MNHAIKLNQAYSITPWRKQLQWIGVFLLVLVFASLVAGIYLNVTSRASSMGRTIQSKRLEMQAVERNIADLESQLARLTSAVGMRNKAKELGFRPLNINGALFVKVHNYSGRQDVVLAPPPQPVIGALMDANPEYSQSLLDWIRKQIYLPPVKLVEGNQ